MNAKNKTQITRVRRPCRRRNLSDTLMAEVGHVIDSLCLNEAQFYTTIQTLGKHVLEPLIVYNTTVIIIFQNKTANFFLMYSANTVIIFFFKKSNSFNTVNHSLY